MSNKKLIGLFFGTFNPIHVGHLVIANYMLVNTEMDELWFVVSPQNPFKKHQSISDDRNRLEMVRLAIDDHSKYKASDVEFYMPKPSYTIDTLAYLTEKYSDNQFALIMGADNVMNLHKWKNYEQLLKMSSVFVYPRPGYHCDVTDFNGNIRLVDAPIMEISSSLIRQLIKEDKDACFFVPEKVYKYIEQIGLYRN